MEIGNLDFNQDVLFVANVIHRINKTTATVVISYLRISNDRNLSKIEGLCSKMTPLDIKEGVKSQIQYLEKSLRHDVLYVVFTLKQ